MSPDIKEIATGVITALVLAGLGALQGIFRERLKAIIDSIKKYSTDLNHAHNKIRSLEERVKCLERTTYYEGD